jgi:hypothetical protein
LASGKRTKNKNGRSSDETRSEQTNTQVVEGKN